MKFREAQWREPGAGEDRFPIAHFALRMPIAALEISVSYCNHITSRSTSTPGSWGCPYALNAQFARFARKCTSLASGLCVYGDGKEKMHSEQTVYYDNIHV